MHSRKHIRLRNFDYSPANAYFITICVQNFICQLGEIRNGIMGLSNIGNTAAVMLQSIPAKRKEVELDEFIIMPNHVHCILDITQGNFSWENANQFGKPVANSISVIVNQYKGEVKKWCNKNAFPDFNWQPKFYDHVIKSDEEYWNIKNYIINNPQNWNDDRFRRVMPTA